MEGICMAYVKGGKRLRFAWKLKGHLHEKLESEDRNLGGG